MLVSCRSQPYVVTAKACQPSRHRLPGLLSSQRNQRLTCHSRRRSTCRRSITISRAVVDSVHGSAPVKPSRQLSLWTALDVGATIGSLGSALACILTAEAALAGVPIALLLVAWYAGRQKERLHVEVSNTAKPQAVLSCCILHQTTVL